MHRHARGGVWLLVLALHGLLVSSLATQWLNPLFNDCRNRPGPAADFFAVYHAGRQVLKGRAPYDLVEVPRVTPTFAPFRYPPGVAYTFGLLVAKVRPWVAYVGWVVLLEILLLVDLWAIRFLVEDARMLERLRWAWLVFPPYYVELWMGQFTFFAASLTLLAIIGWQRSRNRLAAAGWSVASAFKLFPLALAPHLLKRRRFGALAAAGALLGLAMIWFIGKPDDFAGFLRLNFSRPELGEIHAGNFGLQALGWEIVSAAGATDFDRWAIAWRVIAIAIALVAAVAMLRARATDDADAIAAAAAFWLLPLVSKDVWEHYYVVALPAATLMIVAFRERPRSLAATAILLAIVGLPSCLALLQHGARDWYPDRQWSPLARIFYHAPRPLAALAAFGLCVRELFSGARAAASSTRTSAPPTPAETPACRG